MVENNILQEDINSIITQYKTTKNENEQKQLKDFIVLTYLSLVKSIAHSVARRSTDPVEDIIQIGCIGLIKAINFYKPIPEKNFKSYAKAFIVGEIKHYLRDNSELLKSSRAMRELSYKISKVTGDLTKTLGHKPSDEEIANALQITKEKMSEYNNQNRRTTVVSIDNNDSEDEAYSLIEKIEDTKARQTIISCENRMLLDEVINQLNPIEQSLIRDYYYEDFTKSELALKYNLSQTKINSKLQYALDFITKIISKKGINNL